MKKSQTILFGVLAVALAAAGLLFMLRMKAQPQAPAAAAVKAVPAASATNAVAATGGATSRVAQASSQQPETAQPGKGKEKDKVLTADQQLAEKMTARLDEDDQKGALEMARQLMKSSDVEVRTEVVGVLGWIGVKALPELSAMLADADAAVAAAALTQWQSALEEVEDEAVKAQLQEAAMMVLQSQEQLEEIATGLSNLPDALAVRSLVRIIQSGNPVASEVAREQYKAATGEDFTSGSRAEAWLKQNAAEENGAAAKK